MGIRRDRAEISFYMAFFSYVRWVEPADHGHGPPPDGHQALCRRQGQDVGGMAAQPGGP